MMSKKTAKGSEIMDSKVLSVTTDKVKTIMGFYLVMHFQRLWHKIIWL